VLDDNFNFCGQERINNSLETFLERELEKINERLEKIDLFQVGVRKFISIIQNQVVMGCNLFILWFQVVLALRNIGWNELIGQLKDRGKDDSHSRTNSFQPR
jgi:hypothetical protein